ncbi:MAG: MBL fold metallo-hydrolase [Bryobacterales bacterium]|nr:MBL fold metallo-hydrolase [Bryobacterales bacterium]MBV9397248.1 MBL fold metallo-hydrolase [Bryobacterales bacterium]
MNKGCALTICFVLSCWSGGASAQILLAGEWSPQFHEDQPERLPGPDLGDYLGLPINDAARLRAESWNASRLTLQEQQCRVHVSPYIYRGPNNLRIWEEKDPDTQRVIAIKNYISTYSQTRTIWMDGRPHPPDYAPHTWMGFSTGKWEGDILTVETTHIKQGWVRRNGVPMSDQATMTEHFIRHGDLLTHVMVLRDPVYLTEPLIKTEDFLLTLNGNNISWVYPCRYVVEITDRPKTEVPNYLPGANPFMKEFPGRYGVPEAAALGGPETMYPEYRTRMRASSAPVSKNRALPVPANSSDIKIFPVQGNVFLIAGDGGNIAVQKGEQGLLLVDTGNSELREKLIAALRNFSGGPIRYILNTSADSDHVGANEAIANITGSSRHIELVNTPFASAAQAIEIIASEPVAARMNSYASEAWPTETYTGEKDELFFNGEAMEMFHAPAAHTDGDSIVFFRRSDVIATGDIFDTNRYPVIDLAKGGSLQGIIDGLNRVLDLAIPAKAEEGGTMVIPGHGRICDEADVLEYRDMLTIIRDRLKAMIAKAMTLEQIVAARPTMDYDPLYGATNGAWTTDMFVEAAYRSLQKK